MPIRAVCSSCSKTFNLKDEYAGKKIRCPNCKGTFIVPSKNSSRSTKKATPQKNDRPTRHSSASERIKSADRDKTTPMKSQGNPCPSCKKIVPPGEQSCPFCKYHFKLRRKIQIGSAIKSADMHSQGLNLDGSKRVTRADMAEERAAEGRKVGKTVVYSALSIIALVALYLAYSFYVKAVRDFSIEELREMLAKNGQMEKLVPNDPDSYHPAWIAINNDKPLILQFPATQVSFSTPEYTSPWPAGNEAAWAAFCEATMAPTINTGKSFIRKSANPIITQANKLGGSYSPAALIKAPPSGQVFIWRQATNMRQSGSLRGAVLDFGDKKYKADEIIAALQKLERDSKKREKKITDTMAQSVAMGAEMTREEAEKKIPPISSPTVIVTGKLSFIPMLLWDMKGGIGSYDFSVQEGSKFVRNPKTQAKSSGDKGANNYCYFAPVILVDTINIEQPKTSQKKRKKR